MALPESPLSVASPSPAYAVERGYLKESKQPIYSAALVLPFLLIYETGVAVLRSDVINGGAAIVNKLGAPVVKMLGVSGSLFSIIFIVGAFIFWQIYSKGTWRIKPPILAGMFIESLAFAVLLFMILGTFAHYVAEGPPAAPPRRHAVGLRDAPRALPVPAATRSGSGSGTEFRDFILYCGAGVYEELVFRFMLLGLLMLVFTRLLHMEHAYAAAWSVAVGAFIFAAFHHFGEIGDKFEVNVFLQRLIQGLFFSALFKTRSFGIAAGSHALYDILVGLNRLGG